MLTILILLAVAAGGVVLFNQKANGASSAGAEGSAAENEKEGEGGDDEKEKAPVPVKVVEVETGPISAYITATANLVAENEVKILAEAEGRVARVFVEEGDRVARGQVVATLDPQDARIALEMATVREANSRLAWERGRDLSGQQLLAREAMDKLTMEHDLARQERAEAEWRLSKTTIRSPFAGVISQRLVQEGQHVGPGDELYQVTDREPLIARIYLPERDLAGLAEGQDVRLTLNARPDVRFSGRIRQINPVVDTATGTVKVTVEAVKPPEAVRPGSFVTVGVVRETRGRAVLLPRDAVVKELDKAHVFVADGGVAKRREVTLGLEENGWVEARSGVAAGDDVIVAGQGGLKEGAAIKILEGDEA
jgi:membrane fusion protein (multidrug efflux system)